MSEALLTKEAVFEAHAQHPAVVALQSLATAAKLDRGELTITVAPADTLAACNAAKAAGYNFLEDVTCVDWYPSEPRFQVTYHILSHSLKQRLRLCALVSGPSGNEAPAIASITPIWPSANFYEREVFDLFGVRFDGHPRLTRIMMPIDWEGHPLRKDYPVEGYR